MVITGSAETDRKLEAELRAELPRFNDRVQTEILAGLPTFESVGHQAGELVVALLSDAPRDHLALPEVMKMDTHVDWRQVR